MSYILSADWHCHAWSQFSTVTDGVNSRLADVLGQIELMAMKARETGAKRVYAAGDIFHVRGAIKPTVYNLVAETLSRVAKEQGVEFVLMSGNHDLESVESETRSSAITSLGGRDGVVAFSEPAVVYEDKVALLPWENTREGLLSAVATLHSDIVEDGGNPSEYDLHLHTGINGVLIGVPDHGWAPEELAALGFKRVFSGHYHDHKVFDIKGTKVVSIGSPAHQTWRDVGSTSGFIEVRDEDFCLHESTAPQFVDFDPESEAHLAYHNNFVRVRGVELDEGEAREMRDALMEAGALGVVIDPLAKPEVTRSETPAKSIKVEGQIKEFAQESEEGLAEDVEAQALQVLQQARELVE